MRLKQGRKVREGIAFRLKQFRLFPDRGSDSAAQTAVGRVILVDNDTVLSDSDVF